MKEKKDKLEDFVNKHIDDFNQEEPSPELWSRIRTSAPIKKPAKEIKMVPFNLVIKIAAAFLLLIGIGSILLYNNINQPTEQIQIVEEKIEETPVPFSMGNISPELAEIEDYYFSQVSHKLSELDQMDLDPEALEEVNYLNKEFAELQNEFSTSADDDKIIEAMIENYRLRLDILENILHNMNQTEKVFDDEKDTEDIVIYV